MLRLVQNVWLHCFTFLLQLVVLMEKYLCICCYAVDTEILCIVMELVKFKYGHEVPILCTIIQDRSFPVYKFRIFKLIFYCHLVQGKLIIINPFMVLHKPRYDTGQFPCSDLYTVAYPPWYQNWLQKVTNRWNIADVEKLVSWLFWLCWYFITFDFPLRYVWLPW